MTVKRAERLFHLTNILRSGQGYSAGQLAKMSGVSIRTLYRDVVDLSVLVPIYYDKGYRLLDESYHANLAFTRDEMLAIKLGMKMAPLAEASHLAAAARSALGKIEDQLAFRFGADRVPAEVISFHVSADPLTTQNLRVLKTLENAIQENRVVRIKYHAPYRDERTERDVHPYGLTFRNRTWYLVGHCCLRATVRIFRVDRILAVDATAKHFPPPKSFSLEKFFADSWEVYGPGESAQVRIRFTAQLAAAVKPVLARRGEFLPEPKTKAVMFEGKVPVSEEFVRWVLTLGGDAEVLSPPALREAVAEKGRAIAAAYEKKPTARRPKAGS